MIRFVPALVVAATVVIGCASPVRDPSRAACVDAVAPTVRRAIDVVDQEHFTIDVRSIEGPRGAAMRRATGYVVDVLEANGFVVSLQPFLWHAREAWNIVADAPSTGPDDPIVIATAHLDTVRGSPGADDNASGLAALLAIARTHPRRTRLIAFGLEEHGLVGSTHYVRTLSAKERARIRAVYNFDMIAFTGDEQSWPPDANILADLRGRPLRQRADFIGMATLDHTPDVLGPLHEARAFVQSLPIESVRFPSALLRFAPDFQRGDHAPFWAAGVPAVVIGDTAELRNPHYHRSSDRFETLDLAFGTKVAKWAAAGILLAAACP